MVKLTLDRLHISVNDGTWKCENENIQRMLERHITPDGISGYYPDMDYALAELAVKRLGAKIVEADDPPEYVEGRVY